MEVISSDGQRQMIGTRNDSIYLGLHDKTLVSPDVADANAGYATRGSHPGLRTAAAPRLKSRMVFRPGGAGFRSPGWEPRAGDGELP